MAIRFHQNIGPARITARIHELNGQMKEGLGRMPNIQLYTPRDENLSAGMVCFDVKGMKPEQVVKHLLDQRIVASTTPYRLSYARLACSVVNTPQEVDTALRAIRDLTSYGRAHHPGYRVAVRASTNARSNTSESRRPVASARVMP